MARHSKVFLVLLIATLFSVSSVVEAQVSYPVPREEAFVMVWGQFTVWDSFNPFAPQGVQWGAGWHQLVQEWFWIQDLYTNQTLYWLTTGWEYKNDYKEFVLHVREGVKWNDGVPFTANDIAFSINLCIENSVGTFAGFGDILERIEVPDDFTLVLHLKAARPRLHNDFFRKPTVVAEHVWKDEDVFEFKNNPPVGTGPYVLQEVLQEAGMYIWVRDEDWWGQILGLYPAPKYVISKFPEALDITIPQLINGDIDYGPILNGLTVLDAVKAQTDDYAVISNLEIGTFGFYINCDPDPSKYPLNLPEFRRAIAYCVNKEKNADLYYRAERGTPAALPWPSTPDLARYTYPDLFEEYGYSFNPEMAADILDGLDFVDRDGDGIRDTPDGEKISVEILYHAGDEFRLMSQDLADELNKVGIEAILRYNDPAWWDIVQVGDFDIAASGIWPEFFVGDIFGFFNALTTANYAPIGEAADYMSHYRYYNPELDPIVEQLAALNPEDPAADALYHDAVEIYMRDLPLIPVILPTTIWIMSTKYWEGYPGTWTIHAPHHTVADMCLHVRSTAPSAATTITETVTQTTTETEAAETITETATQTTTETVTTMDMTSVAGAGVVALIVGVIVGWLVGKK